MRDCVTNDTQSSPLCVELSQTMPGYMYHFLLAAPGPWTDTVARMMSAVSDRKRAFVNIDSIQDLHSHNVSQTVGMLRPVAL